jgi:hypothetical protein
MPGRRGFAPSPPGGVGPGSRGERASTPRGYPVLASDLGHVPLLAAALRYSNRNDGEAMETMTKTVEFEVPGLPPAKSEAKSMLAAGHVHARRVMTLLETARAETEAADFSGFGFAPLSMEVVIRAPAWDASNATNYLGGIADVLEEKAHRGRLDHLGELAAFAVYANDRQLHDVRLRWEENAEQAYTVTLTEL